MPLTLGIFIFSTNTVAMKPDIRFHIEGFVQAANGDKFFTMVIEEWMDEEGLNHQRSEIIGGTGRFEGCSGELHMTVSIDWVNATFTALG